MVCRVSPKVKVSSKDCLYEEVWQIIQY